MFHQGAGEAADRARDPESPQDAPIDVAAEDPEPLDSSDEVGDGHGRNRELGARREREERRQQGPDPESGDRRDRAGDERERGKRDGERQPDHRGRPYRDPVPKIDRPRDEPGADVGAKGVSPGGYG